MRDPHRSVAFERTIEATFARKTGLSPSLAQGRGIRMRASIHFRDPGETEYRELGVQEVRALPATGSHVTLTVDGRSTRARVVGRREALSPKMLAPGYLNLFLESL